MLKISWLGIHILIQVVTGHRAEKLLGLCALCSSEWRADGVPSASSLLPAWSWHSPLVAISKISYLEVTVLYGIAPLWLLVSEAPNAKVEYFLLVEGVYY